MLSLVVAFIHTENCAHINFGLFLSSVNREAGLALVNNPPPRLPFPLPVKVAVWPFTIIRVYSMTRAQ